MIDTAVLMTQATLLRRRFGEDGSSPIDVFAMAQSLEGLTLVLYPMGDKLSGMCIKGQEGNSLIAVNSSMTMGRQRFSLAHEFFHLFYDDSMISVCARKINSGKDVERSADMFASFFLMPEAALQERAEQLASRHPDGKLTLNDVIRIEKYFGVSHQATVFRLLRTPFLDDHSGNVFLNTAVRKVAESLGYNTDLYKPSPEGRQYMTYGSYIGQAEQALQKGLISQGKYEELLLDAFRSDLVYGEDEEGGDIID